jgi:hypothetical protein
MKIKPILPLLFRILPVLALILSACNGHGTATPLPAGVATITPTLPPGQFPDTPAPTAADTSTPAPTATQPVPTPTYIPFAKNWSLDFLYDKTTSDSKFEYDESLHGTATFTIDSNGILSGEGSGAYTQGLKSKNSALDCGLPLTTPTNWKITGTTAEKNAVAVFHMQIAIKFQSMVATAISCAAAGMSVSILISGSGDILTTRATSFPWNDYLINPTIGLYSALIDGEGIDWKKLAVES